MGINFDFCIQNIKKKLILNDQLYGFDKEQNELLQIIKKTTDFGESDSAIILGPRGCGKSMLMDSVIKSLSPDSHTLVLLNGLIHTDDNLALKSIIQQLQMENLDGTFAEGSYADNISFLLESFRAGNKTASKSIIMVLDQFDMFCSHTNQTLLYNLFDSVQSQQNPLCIIGLTSRIDVIELLEKRVKSRFSHNIMMLKPLSETSQLLERFKHYLTINKHCNLKADVLKNWNNNIESLISDVRIQNLIKDLLKSSNNSAKFNQLIFMSLSNLSNDRILTVENLTNTYSTLFKKDMILVNLLGLSVLELCLVISICHHSEIYDQEPFNFEMIYDRYCKFASRNSTLLVTKRQVIIKAFERISVMQLILPAVVIENKNVLREYRLYKCSVNLDKVKTASNIYFRLPPVILQWIDSNII
ncbi:PREDICTED: origin recognition complex subunit 4 isoform X2 [Diuraphis noxia]|nr:PREDICTED: origin recognition complex subunit 4 isoform X2 [Diuraphis noxia]XP_015366641.1 PREDICTED: origin recognition complex subunit 4 isoform X2 [Diuraphis noxia]XP_015366642.1 PREDICTED: origin recognition complex subunit 4 isoform X2 [Diuraphis noxia]XP_015366643.1 PREDICTED: origin recognition complex subunit 4 isoform X2 [Diuraphis noxia]XP_015366644.1 PREDICTED: origin recognition complex subunit 4 isoform X2 [Diuraphis noxia]XP_015366645.1 PREDICTED: origin recognition complex su